MKNFLGGQCEARMYFLGTKIRSFYGRNLCGWTKILFGWCFGGYAFLYFAFPAVAQTDHGTFSSEEPDSTLSSIYSSSHALLIGCGKYKFWDPLDSVSAEIDSVNAVLRAKGFETTVRKDPDYEDLRNEIDSFISSHVTIPRSRLLIWFSGHGYTIDHKGYIVATDAPLPEEVDEFINHSISMEQIMVWAKKHKKNHILFVFDSCFSGSIIQERSPPSRDSKLNWSKYLKTTRAFITSGSAEEKVPAISVFVPPFIDAVTGAASDADMNEDGWLTSNELGLYLQLQVPEYNPRQTPRFGKLAVPGFDKGEFLFRVKKDAEIPLSPVHWVDYPTPSIIWPLVSTAAFVASGLTYLHYTGEANDLWEKYNQGPPYSDDFYHDYNSAAKARNKAFGATVITLGISGYLWWRYGTWEKNDTSLVSIGPFGIQPTTEGFIAQARF